MCRAAGNLRSAEASLPSATCQPAGIEAAGNTTLRAARILKADHSTMTTHRVTVSGVRNRTHIVYVASWLRHAGGRAGDRFEVVERNSADRLRRELDDPQGLLSGLETVEVVDRHVARDGRHSLVSIGSQGIKAWGKLRFSPSAWPLETVVVDEGIGSYGNATTRRAAMRREGSGAVRATLYAYGGATARRLIPTTPWCLYRLVDGRWQLDERIASEFRRSSEPPENSDNVVFLTQPWVAFGLVQPGVYLAHLDRVRAAVEATGAPFLIRPHPSEDPDLYAGFGVLAATSPAELDPAVTSASYVLGESSTALLNLAAVRGLDAARVVGPLTERSDMALSTRQDALFRQFVPTSVNVDQLAQLLAR